MFGVEALDVEAIRPVFRLSAFFVFLLGASVGSFINVCIYRMPLAGRSVLKPTFSFCFTCGSTLAWYDNLPLVSYLWLFGRCRRCGTVFSSRYFWIELFCALMFLLLFLHYGPSLAFLTTTILGSALVIITFTDLDEYIIPDEITLGGIGVGLLLSIIAWKGPSADSPLAAGLVVRHPKSALLGALLGAGALYAIGWLGTRLFRKEAMGLGDVKLLGMMGTFIGPVNVILTIFLASCIGAVFGLARIGVNALLRRRTYAHLPFGPYLAVGGFLSIFIGPSLLGLLFPPETWAILRENWFGQ